MRRAIAILGILCVQLTAGCAHWTEVRSEPPPLGASTLLQSASNASLVLDEVTATLNGQPAEVSPAFQERIAQALRRAGLFGRVYGPGLVQDAPAGSARARLWVVEEEERHLGASLAKGALIGISLFTLTPLLPLRVDKTVSMWLRVELPDGQQRVFTVSTRASAYFQLYADAEKAGADLDAVVTNRNLEGIASRVGTDPAIRAFLQGSEAT